MNHQPFGHGLDDYHTHAHVLPVRKSWVAEASEIDLQLRLYIIGWLPEMKVRSRICNTNLFTFSLLCRTKALFHCPSVPSFGFQILNFTFARSLFPVASHSSKSSLVDPLSLHLHSRYIHCLTLGGLHFRGFPQLYLIDSNQFINL